METTIRSAAHICVVCTLLGMVAVGLVSIATLTWVAIV